MLLRAPEDCNFKRSWHFWQLFPRKDVEYCTNVALEMAFGHGKFVPFDAEAFYAAWFAARRFGVGSKLAYRRDIP